MWDYPRPPKLERISNHLRVLFGGETIADSHRCCRVLETSHPPVYYIDPADVAMQYIEPAKNSSFCEWKGKASYWSIKVGDQHSEQAAWSYESPSSRFEGIRGYFAFYVNKVDACYVDDELVLPQPGSFYGGWITKNIVGPFKGGVGTQGW